MEGEVVVRRQSPAERLDWKFDFSWLTAEDNDYIIEHTVTCDSDDVEITDSHDSDTVTIWLSGGQLGDSIVVDCVVTTNNGREAHDALRIWIANP